MEDDETSGREESEDVSRPPRRGSAPACVGLRTHNAQLRDNDCSSPETSGRLHPRVKIVPMLRPSSQNPVWLCLEVSAVPERQANKLDCVIFNWWPRLR
jgi:hypothetical protein